MEIVNAYLIFSKVNLECAKDAKDKLMAPNVGRTLFESVLI